MVRAPVTATPAATIAYYSHRESRSAPVPDESRRRSLVWSASFVKSLSPPRLAATSGAAPAAQARSQAASRSRRCRAKSGSALQQKTRRLLDSCGGTGPHDFDVSFQLKGCKHNCLKTFLTEVCTVRTEIQTCAACLAQTESPA